MLRRKKCLLPDFAPKSHTELIPSLETADGEIPARDDSRRGSPREPESSVEIELTLNERTTALYTRGTPYGHVAFAVACDSSRSRNISIPSEHNRAH